jgi:hypothetical protein
MFPCTIDVHESFRNDHANGLCLDDHAKEALNRATSAVYFFSSMVGVYLIFSPRNGHINGQSNGFNDEHDSEESKVLAEDTVAHPELHSNLTKVSASLR